MVVLMEYPKGRRPPWILPNYLWMWMISGNNFVRLMNSVYSQMASAVDGDTAN